MKKKINFILVVGLFGFLNGCASYDPGPESRAQLSTADARTIVATTTLSRGLNWNPDRIETDRHGIRLVYSNGRSDTCRFDRIARAEQHPAGDAILRGCPSSHLEYPSIRCQKNSDCRRLVDAIQQLKLDYLARQAPETPQQQAAFDAIARQFHAGQYPPALPEGAQRYKAQAELAVQEKRFDDAADLYEQALKIAPWWPAGYFNRGQLLGGLEAYAEAVRDLQKYLKLVPEAPNAQAVQTLIYQWEGKTNSKR